MLSYQQTKPKKHSFVRTTFCIQYLLSEVDVESNSSDKTNTATTLSKEEMVLTSIGLSTKDDDCDLPSMYWVPKLHKNSYKQRYIAGSAKYTTKPL